MTIRWKTVEQYFTLVLFGLPFYSVCYFGTLLDLALSRVEGLTSILLFSSAAVMNNTSNNTSPRCSFGVLSASTIAAQTTAYALVFIVAILGNCAIILIVRTKRRIRKVAFNFFIISMATADILDALVAIPLTVKGLFVSYRWIGGLLGHITCKVFQFLNVLSLHASIFTLTAISVERYVAVVHVLREPLSAKKVKIVIALLWLFSAATVTTYLYKYKVYKLNNGMWYCTGIWDSDPQENQAIIKVELLIKFLLFYSLPLLTMAILYSLVIWVLKKRQAFGENMTRIRIQRQNKTVVKMLVTVVVIFAFSWLPLNVITLMLPFYYDKLLCAPFALITWMFWPAHANSAINPCIYLVFNENFRKGLRELLARCLRRKAKGIRPRGIINRYNSSAFDRGAHRADIKGHFREISRGKTSDSDEVFDTRL